MKLIIKSFIFFFIIFFLLLSCIAQENDQKCDSCKTDDDEYCIYNQCYFDKQYRLLKNNLNLNSNQENDLDNIYLNYKQDLEIQCDKYIKYKNELLNLIANNEKHLKQEKNNVRYIKKDIQEKHKDYLASSRNVLNRKQKRTFNKFNRSEKRKIRQIKRYGAIYKYPCP